MRTVMAMTLLALLASASAADDRDKKVAEQKKQAESALNSLEAGEFAFVATKHLLVYGPKVMAKSIQAKGAILEKYHDQALKAANLDEKEAYPGKITVFLLTDVDLAKNFLRQVAKVRPRGGETGSYKAEDDALHAMGVSTDNKVPVEVRAGEQLAALLLQRKAARRTELPDWLTAGFGRATSYQVSPREKFVLADRKQISVLSKKHEASAIWDGKVEGEQAECLQGSLVEFLAYTKSGQKFFAKFIAGFAPGENEQTKTTAQALESAGLKAETVAKGWKAWVK